jgi:hypothetical protein
MKVLSSSYYFLFLVIWIEQCIIGEISFKLLILFSVKLCVPDNYRDSV